MAIFVDIASSDVTVNINFGSLSGAIDGVNTTFIMPGEVISSKSDFVIYRNGQLISKNDYSFTPPYTITFTAEVPKAPDRLEYLRLK